MKKPYLEKENHGNGHAVREKFTTGSIVEFRPKNLLSEHNLKGMIKGHIYSNVLIIEDFEGREWWCSSIRVLKIIIGAPYEKNILTT